jgi:hypothetical protein
MSAYISLYMSWSEVWEIGTLLLMWSLSVAFIIWVAGMALVAASKK